MCTGRYDGLAVCRERFAMQHHAHIALPGAPTTKLDIMHVHAITDESMMAQLEKNVHLEHTLLVGLIC